MPPNPNLGDGTIELAGAHRDAAGNYLANAPLAIRVVRGALAVTRAAGSDTRRLHATSAVQVNAGVITNTAGAAGDTELLAVLIQQNGVAVTLTIAGFQDETGTAQSIV